VGTLALVLLVGLAGGVVLTVVAGARRSSTAYERFRQETLAGDLDVAPSNPDPALFDKVERLPQVEAMARTAFPFIRPAGSDLYPYLDFLAIVGTDEKFGRVVNRPRVVRGRMPDPARAGEFAVTERFAAERGLEVGDRVRFESYGPDQVEALFGDEGEAVEPSGPVATLTVTGMLAVPDFLGESSSFEIQALLSRAFHRQYRDRIGIYPGSAQVRLREGSKDVPAVVEAVRRIYRDDPELELEPASAVGARIDDTFGVLVVALVVFAACAGVVGAVVVGQALVRHLSQSSVDQHTLAGLGMGRPQRIAALTAAAVPIAVGGALVAVGVAVAASPLMPVGVARRAEPDLGVSVDGSALALGSSPCWRSSPPWSCWERGRPVGRRHPEPDPTRPGERDPRF